MNSHLFYSRFIDYANVRFLCMVFVSLCFLNGCSKVHDDNTQQGSDTSEQVVTDGDGNLFIVADDVNASDDDSLGATLIGDFSGALACQSCDGMFIRLNLYADGSAEKTITYSAKQNKMPDTKVGRYQQHKDRIALIYVDGQTEDYKIKDNQLILIKSTPKDPFSDEVGDYVLSRR